MENTEEKERIKQAEKQNLKSGVTHGDRVQFWTNFNVELLNRISEIKASQ